MSAPQSAENDATPPWLPEVECVWCGFVSRTAPHRPCPMCGGAIPPVVTDEQVAEVRARMDADPEVRRAMEQLRRPIPPVEGVS